MKFILHFPLFVIIFVIYNLALVFNRDSFKPDAAAKPAAEQVAPAETTPAPEPDASEPGAPAQSAPPAAGEAAVPSAVANAIHPLDKPLFFLPLPSGASMPVSMHEFLLILAVFLLYIELFKSTKTGTSTIVEHVFSLLVFMAFFIELIMWRPAGTPTFFVITLLAFLDVVAGFTITISTARRDFGMGAHAGEAG